LKNNPTLISIIIPVYNREDKVGRAIDSVLNQTFSNWELILINDNSSDNSLGVISTYQDDRIVIIDLKENGGAAAARNVGIKRARGKFIAFLDSDDCYSPKFLERSFSVLIGAENEIGFSWTGYTFVTSSTHKSQFWSPSQSSNNYLSFLSNLHTGTNSGLMVKAEVFDVCGYFDERLLAAEDTDLLLRIIQKFKFTMIPDPLINIYTDHSNRLSVDFRRIAAAYNLIFPKHERVISKYTHLKLKWYYKMMWLNYHLGEKLIARTFFKRLLKVDLKYFRAWLIFLLFEGLGQENGVKAHIYFSKKLE
jgi:glycosyltransferase involved in cell wall biosynthesis